jgi:hypothetical protein
VKNSGVDASWIQVSPRHERTQVCLGLVGSDWVMTRYSCTEASGLYVRALPVRATRTRPTEFFARSRSWTDHHPWLVRKAASHGIRRDASHATSPAARSVERIRSPAPEFLPGDASRRRHARRRVSCQHHRRHRRRTTHRHAAGGRRRGLGRTAYTELRTGRTGGGGGATAKCIPPPPFADRCHRNPATGSRLLARIRQTDAPLPTVRSAGRAGPHVRQRSGLHSLPGSRRTGTSPGRRSGPGDTAPRPGSAEFRFLWLGRASAGVGSAGPVRPALSARVLDGLRNPRVRSDVAH